LGYPRDWLSPRLNHPETYARKKVWMPHLHSRLWRWGRCLLPLVPLLLAASGRAAAENVRRTRYPAISPDGHTICFSYLGDLWTVPADGGRAARLTVHPARDIQPRYSPDGRWIVFASDRFGNYDLFLMPAEGGEPRRLTYNSGFDFPSGFTPDSKWVVYYSNAYGVGDLYKVRTTGGEPIRLTWDNREWKYLPRVSPDGQWIAYDFNGSPGSWRHRGYQGSNNADIWLARFATPIEAPARLTENPGQDFAPLWAPDGETIYYVSDRGGEVNLWSMDRKGGHPRQITHYQSDGVRLPDISADGKKIVYEYNSEIWICDTKSGAGHAVPIQAPSDTRENLNAERTFTTGLQEYEVSPDGEKAALLVRGELFAVTTEKGGVARRLTHTPDRESHITWNRDSRAITYVSDRSGNKDLFQVDLQGNETRLTATPQDETNPLYSPDGKYLAYHRGDHEIVVTPADAKSGNRMPVAIIPGNFVNVTRFYGSRFCWSPDGKWIAYLESGDRMERAVFVYNLEEKRATRITEWLRNASTPSWSRDGRMIYFAASPVDNWDIYAVDLQPRDQSFAEDELDKLDPQPRKQPEKEGSPPPPGQTPDAATRVAGARQAFVRTPDGRIVPVLLIPKQAAASGPAIDFNGIEHRLRRVTSSAASDSDPWLTPDGKTFLYSSEGNLWLAPADPDSESRPVQIAGNGGTGLQLSEDGRTAYFVNGGRLFALSLGNRTLRPIPFQATMNIDLMAENRQVFNETWWVLDRYFYDARHHGVNWQGIKEKYASLLPYAPYKEDFYDLMSEMVQELDASHLGITGAGGTEVDSPDETAYLGIEPDWPALEREGKVRIGRVIAESPADNAKSRLKVGEYILAVDGQEVGKDGTFEALLNRKAGKKVVLLVNSSPSPAGAREVALRPLTPEAGRDLEYEAWVESRRQYVEQASGGRVGYVHIRQMEADDLERFKRELVSKASGKQALIVDVRYNPGGHVAPSILDILQKRPWTMVRPRNSATLMTADWYWGDYDWGKPAALLINQYSASNAEMMAEGFRSLGIGPVVGVPTAGGVIGTNSWTLLDGGTLRTPSIGVFTAAGENLEGKGRHPDLTVPYDPIAIRNGRDPQLDRAIQALSSKLPPGSVARRP
jgi:tricorn protease